MRSILLFAAAALALAGAASVNPGAPEPIWGGELRFAIHSEPKSWDPLLAADDASDAIRLLTSGFLIRLNRKTLKYRL